MLDFIPLSEMLHEDLIFFDFEAKDRYDLIDKLSAVAVEAGYAVEGYSADVVEREDLYPTGLPVEGMKVAIPHAMVQDHVVDSAIVIAKLIHPIDFKEMGDGENDVPVEMVFLLVVKGDHGTLAVLTQLISIFAEPVLLARIEQATTSAELVELLPKLAEQAAMQGFPSKAQWTSE